MAIPIDDQVMRVADATSLTTIAKGMTPNEGLPSKVDVTPEHNVTSDQAPTDANHKEVRENSKRKREDDNLSEQSIKKPKENPEITPNKGLTSEPDADLQEEGSHQLYQPPTPTPSFSKPQDENAAALGEEPKSDGEFAQDHLNTAEQNPRLNWIEDANSDPETIITAMTNDGDFIADMAQQVLPDGVEFTDLPEDSQAELVFAVRDSLGNAANEALQQEHEPDQSNDQANKLLQQQAAERFLQQQNLDRTFALNQYAAGEQTYLTEGVEAVQAEALAEQEAVEAEALDYETTVANEAEHAPHDGVTTDTNASQEELGQTLPTPKPGAASDETKESVGNIVQAIRAEKMQTTGVEKGNEGGFASRIMERLESHHESKNSSPSTIPTPSIPTGG